MILSLRNRLKILIYLGAGILFIVSLFDNGPAVSGITINRLSIVEAVLIFLLGAFDRVIWRFKAVLILLNTGPVLKGTWKGVVKSADTGKEYEAYLSVRQTFTQIKVRLMTAESTSETSTCQLTQGEEGLSVIEYLYVNVPRKTIRTRSPIHFGATRLECVGNYPDSLAGSYWTDRMTGGELSFNQKKANITHNYNDARNLFV